VTGTVEREWGEKIKQKVAEARERFMLEGNAVRAPETYHVDEGIDEEDCWGEWRRKESTRSGVTQRQLTGSRPEEDRRRKGLARRSGNRRSGTGGEDDTRRAYTRDKGSVEQGVTL